jgi:hypothetical protein
MEPPNFSSKGILNRLGIIKNELLIFVVLVCLILNGSAYGLDRSTDKIQQSGGLIMHFSSILIIIVAVGFYIYAYLLLPSSSQELVFVTDAKKMTTEHQNRRRKTAESATRNV